MDPYQTAPEGRVRSVSAPFVYAILSEAFVFCFVLRF